MKEQFRKLQVESSKEIIILKGKKEIRDFFEKNGNIQQSEHPKRNG